jgi:hypothetical protein
MIDLAQGSWIVAWMEDSKRTVNYRLRNSELALIRRQKLRMHLNPFMLVTKDQIPLNPDFVSKKFTCELPCIKDEYIDNFEALIASL